MKGKKSLCGEFCNCYCQNFVIVFLQKLCDFKMDLQWQLNFVSWNFGRNHTFDFKLNSCYVLVHFWNYAYDFRPNCTPLTSITIINSFALIELDWELTFYFFSWIRRAFHKLFLIEICFGVFSAWVFEISLSISEFDNTKCKN